MAAVRTIDFLPKFFRTGTNSKFLKATLDQMVAEPDLVKLNGYVGRKNAANYKSTDNYITELSKARENYQLEPSIIGKDATGSINFVSGYQDLLSKLQYMGVNTTDQSRLFSNEFYTFNGLIDFDKFVNFSQYYWLPSGPDSVAVFSSVVPFAHTYNVEYDAAGRGVTVTGSGPTLNPTITLARNGTYTFTAPLGSKIWIQTEPGVSGVRATQENISTREVFGVTNNGSNSVGFSVPSSTSQDAYLNMKRVAEVDIATSLTYATIQGKRMSEVLEKIGSADGYRQIAGKTVIFLNGETDADWDAGGVYSADLDTAQFDFSEPVPAQFRRGVWQISSDIGPEAIVQLNYVADVNTNEKVLVREGTAYSNRELYLGLSGKYAVVPVITSIQDTLYYQDDSNPDLVGIIRLVNAGEVAPINIADIVGKVGYTSPNGVVFTNGLKIQFDENVLPASYARSTYFIEGVGSGIKLVDAGMLITPESFNKNTTIGYDTITYDSNTLETSLSSPQDPSYITINRASKDLNAWSRSNRWFHEDVINLTAQYNSNPPIINQAARASRPIIEFDADLALFNHGTVGKRAIALLDTVTTDIRSMVDGKPSYTVDGSELFDGMRVIFAAEHNESLRNKIFNVTFFEPEISGADRLLRLVLADDSEFDVNQNIVVTAGLVNGGKSFWFNGAEWQLAQQKTSIIQEPLFDVFDRVGVSFGNAQKYVNTTFAGTKIFSYKRGVGKADAILGFPLSYRNFNSIGDIVFDNNFGSDSFTYNIDSYTFTEKLSTGLVHQVSDNKILPRNMWSKAEEPSVQYQQFSYEFTGSSNSFVVDVQPLSSRNVPTLKAFVNNKLLQQTDYSFLITEENYTVTVHSSLNNGDKIDIYVNSDTASQVAVYQTPLNLDNNSVNEEFLTVTLGQMRNHVEQCFINSLDTRGEFPGSSNIRDIVIKDNPGKILQHSAPLTYANLFLTNSATNFERGLDLARREYTRFKNKFLELAFSAGDVNPSDIPGSADTILQNINLHKTPEMPWYRSDMLAYGGDKQVITHQIVSEVITSYEITAAFDVSKPSNKSIYVYLDGVQLTKGRDYTFNATLPEILLSDALVRNAGSVITIHEYDNTDGCWIPETPTKLGLYPIFTPAIYVDTSFREPQTVIRGHDGSITIAFGDFRDELLLELELRIYNNIKTVYNPDRFDINNILPGKFRKTNISLSEVTGYLAKSFLKWVGTNRLDYVTNTFYSNSDGFTWNYRKFVDVVDGESLPGGWRGIFRYFFDCETPHLTPWEMLGFTDHPLWWDETYGPAPYTSGNLVLWDDLEAGRIIKGSRAGIHEQYKRPGLTSILPVNEFGELLSPHEFIVRQYEERNTNLTFIVGDVGPVEAAWRRSSEYAFAVQLAVALAAPARYFGIQVDSQRYIRDTALDQFVFADTNARIQQTDIKIHGEEYVGVVHYGAGYVNWVADYSRSLGFNAKETIGDAIYNLSVQLSYKMAGFSDKKLLKIYAEQANPNSSNASVMIPDEDYSLELHKSVPVMRVNYSAVIVTKTTNGWAVEGYDLENPFFTIVPGDTNGQKQEITDGQISVYKFKGFLPEKVAISYGAEFYTRQAVADFLFGYERYLISQGFVFNARSAELNQLQDWTLSVREFLNWSQQGWTTGNILALSPVASTLSIVTTMSQIDELNDPYIGGRVLDINFRTQSNKELVVTRDESVNTISLSSGIIGFVELIMVQYEHTVVLNNLTVFNDVIYQPALGNRQSRLKIVGKKTGNWLGTLSAPGFILNQDNIPQWQAGHDYRKADLVKYKGQLFVATANVAAADEFDYTTWSISDYGKIKQGLLPNFANIAQRIDDFYNVDDINLESDIDVLSKGLIGFRSRKYFNDFAMDDTSQVTFYQGYIRDKGSRRAIESLTRAQLDRLSSDISFFEDWAFRVGEYGAIDSTQDIEIKLNEANFTAGPAFISLLADEAKRPLDRIGVKYSDLYKRPKDFSPDLFLATDSIKDQNFEFKTAGPVRIDDADYTLFDIRDYASLGSEIDNIGAGTKIWVAHDYANNWNIFRVDQTGIQIHTLTNLSNQLIRLRSDAQHGMVAGEIILLKNISEIFDGFYQIISVPNLNDIIVTFTATDLSGFDQATSLSGYVLKLSSLKLEYPSDASLYTPNFGWRDGDKIWAENNVDEQAWAVYEKSSPWNQKSTLRPVDAKYHENFGSKIARSYLGDKLFICSQGKQQVYAYRTVNSTKELIDTMVPAGAPNSELGFGKSVAAGSGQYVAVGSTAGGVGAVHIYKLGDNSYNLVQTCTATDGAAIPSADNYSFGESIAMSENDAWMYVGFPGASAVYVYALQPNNTTTPFALVHVIQGPDVIGATAPVLPLSGFGKSLAITSNGSRIAVGAPTAKHPAVYKSAGAVYVFDRICEAHISSGTQQSFKLPTTMTGVAGSLRRVTVDAIEIPLSQVTVTSEITLNFTPAASSVVRFEFDNMFEPLAKLTSGESEVLANFGESIAFSADGSTLLVGAPLSDDTTRASVDSGAVYRFVDQGVANNQIQTRARTLTRDLFAGNTTLLAQFDETVASGKTVCVIPGTKLSISDFQIEMTGLTLESAVSDINAAKIPGVNAAIVGDVLVIQKSRTQAFTTLRVGGIASSLLGMNIFVNAQKIVSPNPETGARFGACIDITGDGSKLVISSLAGTTTGDLLLDAGGTKFDDRSTSFNTKYKNSGSVYVFQCLPGGSTKFVPIPAAVIPDDTNGGGGGGGGGGTDGGGGGGTDDSNVIFRDLFDGTGDFGQTHIPEIGKNSYQWIGIGNQGDTRAEWQLSDGKLFASTNFDNITNGYFYLPTALTSGSPSSSFEELSTLLLSKQLQSWDITVDYTFTGDMHFLEIDLLLTSKSLFDTTTGMQGGVMIAFGSTVSADSTGNRAYLYGGGRGAAPIVLSAIVPSGDTVRMQLTWEQSTDLITFSANGIAIGAGVKLSENFTDDKGKPAVDANIIAGLVLPVGFNVAFDKIEISGIPDTGADDSVILTAQTLAATEYETVVDAGATIAQRNPLASAPLRK